nr:G patch domain-containing protein 1 isoform X10 [Paramormyrops kingsleyae]
MADSDTEDFVTYGTPLDPIEEDEPLKKPVPLHDQTVKDEKGRFKRFHGAFTGGFSAGYFNTVGSKEGWAPSTFVSSRQQKAGKVNSRPEDFMDDEDFSEHGIAPREITTTEDFTSGRQDTIRDKARALNSLVAPIPGDTVLEDLIAPARTSVGVEMLKKMGWKEGQGIGPRAKRKPRKQNVAEAGTRIYSCALPPNGSEESEEEEDEYTPENVTFAPKDVMPIDFTPKDDPHGLGYRGLDPHQALTGLPGMGHIDLFTLDSDRTSNLLGTGGPKHRRKGGISGEAFGVGALEDADADIYDRDALSNYDSVLGGEEPGDGLFGWTAPAQYNKKTKGSSRDASYLGKILEGFTLASQASEIKTIFPPPELPRNYRPVHYFRPVVDLASTSPMVAQVLMESKGHMPQQTQEKGRHQLDASQRRDLLGESSLTGPASVFDLLDNKDKERLEGIRRLAGVGASGAMTEERRAAVVAAGVAAAAAKASQSALSSLPQTPGSEEVLSAWRSPTADTSCSFRPFEKNPPKQARYDQYISKLKQGHKDALESSLDGSMTEWERGRERDEFVRAAMLYKPSSSSLSSRFTRAKHEDNEDMVEVAQEQEGDVNDKQSAVKMKMFGKLTRDTFEWHPDKLLCKRFNIPDPYPGSGLVGLPKVKKDKYSVFNFLTLTDSRPESGGPMGAQSQPDSSPLAGPPKRAEPGKKSRWDMSERAGQPKDALSEFLSEARSEASTSQQPASSQPAPAPSLTPEPPALSQLPPETQQLQEEEEESRPPMDLFKAIFASSSDEKSSSSSEDNSEEEDDEDGHRQMELQPPGPLNTGMDPSALPVPSSAAPEAKPPPEQPKLPAAPSKEQRQEEEEFGPKLPPPTSSWPQLPASSSVPQGDAHKKKCKEKHKSKKEAKKKHKKKHKKHKGKKEKKKEKKKKPIPEESDSTSDGSADSDSDADDLPGSISTEQLLTRLKSLRGKKYE